MSEISPSTRIYASFQVLSINEVVVHGMDGKLWIDHIYGEGNDGKEWFEHSNGSVPPPRVQRSRELVDERLTGR